MGHEKIDPPTLAYARTDSFAAWWRPWYGWVAAFLLAPFIVMLIYVVFSRWPARIFTVRSDFMFVGISCVAGTPFAMKLPLPIWIQVALAGVYAVFVNFVIDRFMLYAIGYIFDDWI